MNKTKWALVCLITIIVLFGQTISAQTNEFTYQGRLLEGSAPANGNYFFEFRLFDAVSGGTQQGSTVTLPNVVVTNGTFSVKLNFGNTPFQGANRFLEIRVVHSNNGGTLTTLTPRQQITSAPYSIKSLNTDQLGGVAASQYVLSGATSINAATQYNIGGNRVLSIGGSQNTFLGINAGSVNTGSGNSFFGDDSGRFNSTGDNNSFFGFNSGDANTTGSENSFFGGAVGSANTTGSQNSFFGRSAGAFNTTGSQNSFFGLSAGRSNTIGPQNSYFGFEAGRSNVDGGGNSLFGSGAGRANVASVNSFFGNDAGVSVTTGGGNSFFGAFAGDSITTGEENTFIGFNAGGTNTTGNKNTAIGSGATVGNNLSFATAIGAGATVSNSNTIQLGRSSDTVVVPGGFSAATTSFSVLTVTTRLRVTLVAAGGSDVEVCREDSTSALSICTSSIRYKTNVQPFNSGLSLIQRLRPVTFNWKSDNKATFGLIAEEVNEVEPLLTVYNDKGEIEGVKYKLVSVILVNAVKEQQQQIESQQKQIDEQNQSLKQQQEKLNSQQSEIDALKALVCSQNPTAQLCKPKEK